MKKWSVRIIFLCVVEKIVYNEMEDVKPYKRGDQNVKNWHIRS